MLMLSDLSENESYNEVIRDLGKNSLIEPDIVESSDERGREETVINSVVDRVLKSVECSLKAEIVKCGEFKKKTQKAVK
jgi:hypothetical protein